MTLGAGSPVMTPETRTYVAGHRGMVGSAVLRRLTRSGYHNVITRTSSELDLRDQAAVDAFFDRERPEVVVLAAARVGGILANSTYPADFLHDNLRIGLNVIDAAFRFGARKLLNLGSSCIYPRLAPQPLKEEYLLTGPLEETNRAYAVAKIAAIELCDAYRRQHGADFVSAMPTNLYGPGDNFDLESGHVLAALIRRFHEAKEQGSPTVELWGTGSPRREFLHVDDLAEACLFLMDHFDATTDRHFLNVGTGTDLTIRELAETVRDIVGYTGAIAWNADMPDGTPRKLLDVSGLADLGWRARIPLSEGIRATYEWYQRNHP